MIKTHTTIGAEILAGSRSPLLRLAEQIALTHHERWDGRGYPSGLSGERDPDRGTDRRGRRRVRRAHPRAPLQAGVAGREGGGRDPGPGRPTVRSRRRRRLLHARPPDALDPSQGLEAGPQRSASRAYEVRGSRSMRNAVGAGSPSASRLSRVLVFAAAARLVRRRFPSPARRRQSEPGRHAPVRAPDRAARGRAGSRRGPRRRRAGAGPVRRLGPGVVARPSTEARSTT